jgi:hypothetical protein
MNNQQSKNRKIILIIFAMSFIPFLIAFYLKENPTLLKTYTNNGELIIPPVNSDLLDLTGVDHFSSVNISELAGHWVLVNVNSGSDCQNACLDALFKAKQIVLMMNKDLTRIRRVILLMNNNAPDVNLPWWNDDPRLLKVKPSSALTKKLNGIQNAGIPEGSLFLMDPLGNVMMQYKPDFDPYKVKDDLKKLLAVSQIG